MKEERYLPRVEDDETDQQYAMIATERLAVGIALALGVSRKNLDHVRQERTNELCAVGDPFLSPHVRKHRRIP